MFRKNRISTLPNTSDPAIRNGFTILFFILFFCTGLLIFRDYGTFYDEYIDTVTGLVNTRYILQLFWPDLLTKFPGLASTPDLETYPDRIYGVLYQLPAAVLPQILGFTDSRDNIFFRHLLNFIYFFGGVLAFFFLLKQRFGESWWPLIGCIFLVLSPRIFADSFYNGKDIVFLSFLVLSWYTLNQLRQKLSWKWVMLHALTSAMAFDTRIMGLLLPGLTFLWLAHLGFYSGSWPFRKKLAIQLLAYGILFIGFAILLFPHLWIDPWEGFLEVVQKLDRKMDPFLELYMGELVPFNALPWHYVPVWIFITTPLIYSFWFLVGLGGFFLKLFRHKIDLLHHEKGQQDATAVLLFFLPILVVIATQATLYDGWRHLFFLYPPFLFLALVGFQECGLWFKKNGHQTPTRITGQALTIITGLALIKVFWLIVIMHPFQNVYFSFLPPAYVEQHFSRDYWGLSFRHGLEYILQTDNRPKIKIPDNLAIPILKPEERQRLKVVPEEEADYDITNFRLNTPPPYHLPKEVYSLKVNGLKIMSVSKLK